MPRGGNCKSPAPARAVVPSRAWAARTTVIKEIENDSYTGRYHPRRPGPRIIHQRLRGLQVGDHHALSRRAAEWEDTSRRRVRREMRHHRFKRAGQVPEKWKGSGF